MILDETGRLFGKINLFDLIMLTTLVLVAVGILAVQSGWHRTSGQMVEGETDIQYSFYMANVKTLNPDLFKTGDKVSMTIRNQPRGELEIIDVERQPYRVLMPATGGGVQAVENTAETLTGYNYLVTVKDHALITRDGYVTEGIKVKTGMTVDVEGFDYRLHAIIADVRKLGQ